MKINFDSINQNPNANKVTTSQEKSSVYRTSTTKNYALDISGTVMDNTAYGVHGRTTEDVMQNADAQLDIDVQRDYMTVMSNSMSEEDYNRMMEEGFDPAGMDPKEAVTIVDHIKASMAEAGQIVAGYNDDLSAQKLSGITGNEGYARKIEQALKQADVPVTKRNTDSIENAVAKAEEVTQLSDSAKKYMIENKMDPTIENLYYASYSAGNDATKQAKGYYSQDGTGYFAKKADEINWQQLGPQVEKAVEGMDFFGDSNDYLEDAKWLVETGIPVTKDAILQLQELNQITFPLEPGKMIDAAACAISEGKSAMDGILGNQTGSIYEQAYMIKEQTSAITDEAIDQVLKTGESLNLYHLFAAQSSIETEKTANIQMTPEMISAKKQLLQVQLKMTVDANIRLLKSDYAIDTAPLTALIDNLDEQENMLKQQFFGETADSEIGDKSAVYQNTITVLEEIPNLPAAVIGRMLVEKGTSVSYLHTAGNLLKTQYEAAGETYEALMTAPRSDLGDSIKKAFQNTDDILSDLGLELTESNRKAVRILGYNQMAITTSNVKQIKALDKQVENVVKAMTPGKTLSLIREGVNPLTENLDQLEDKLLEMEQQPKEDTEKYSRFLYQLEQNKEITEAERGAYIGVYRLFHQLEKSDGAAIGQLAEQGLDPTLGNLLTVLRSRKAKNMDVSVDESFGMVSEMHSDGASISRQIEDGVFEARLSHGIYRDMTPAALKQANVSDDMTIEELSENIQAQRETSGNQANSTYPISEDIQRAAAAEKEIYEYLDNNQIPVSPDQIVAAEELLNQRGTLFTQLKKYRSSLSEQEGQNPVLSDDKQSNDFIEQLTGKEATQDAYQDMVTEYREILNQAQDSVIDNSVDVKMLSLCHKQLSLAASLSLHENYEIPVVLEGALTSINLTIIHNSEEPGCVSVTMQTEECGKTGVKIYQDGDKLTALFATDKEEALDRLKQLGEKFTKSIQESGKEVTQAGYHVSHDLNLLTFPEHTADNNNTDIDTKELYQTAKQFLTVLTAGRS